MRQSKKCSLTGFYILRHFFLNCQKICDDFAMSAYLRNANTALVCSSLLKLNATDDKWHLNSPQGSVDPAKEENAEQRTKESMCESAWAGKLILFLSQCMCVGMIS